MTRPLSQFNHVPRRSLLLFFRARYHLSCVTTHGTLVFASPAALTDGHRACTCTRASFDSDGSACRCLCTCQLQPVPAGDLWDGIRSVSYREGRWASGDLLVVDSEPSHCRFRAEPQHQLTHDDACRRHCRCQLQPVSGRDLWDWIRSGCIGDSFSLPESPTLSTFLHDHD
jgi:hypothetical protein